ncbi:hypothetical protein PILCRDRAFT_16820 [Piloderma croceum F 1598]|uniref:Uncharacterized protein n=1 Tax=Piloderma croceum (strain F 1598) TaxID=765440 RepID=A0A0C3B354_PILCF|nr:hypothetical protein PILCRDRAFT_16820 [Piloderma croceum F 1598]
MTLTGKTRKLLRTSTNVNPGEEMQRSTNHRKQRTESDAVAPLAAKQASGSGTTGFYPSAIKFDWDAKK